MVVFITNHSNDNTGDLYVSLKFSAPVEQVSPIASLLSFILKRAVSQFMKALFPSPPMAFLRESEVTVWMMSCGGLVLHQESFRQLATAMRRWVVCPYYISLLTSNSLRFARLIGFTAAELHPCLTTSFVVGYAQAVLVEKHGVEQSLQRLLPSLSTVCRHTNVVHLWRDGMDLQGCRYDWVHSKIRPWGNDLPVQCGQCGHVRSWVTAQADHGAVIVACKTPGCPVKNTFNREDKNWFGGEVSGGRWIKVDFVI